MCRMSLFVAVTLLIQPTLLTAQISEVGQTFKLASVRTSGESAAQFGGSRSQQLKQLREVVRTSPLGQRGLDRIFKNFRSPALDPTTPGFVNNFNRILSPNSSVRKGAIRTHLYAERLARDPRFKVLRLNDPYRGPSGTIVGDRDISVQHKATGYRWWIEVKDVKTASQRRDLSRLKRQINQMAADRVRTGQPKIWVNRRPVIPELKTYARQHGVLIFENASAGQRIASSKTTPFDQVKESMHRASMTRALIVALASGMEIGLGAWVMVDASLEAYKDLFESRGTSEEAWLRFGQHASQFMLGGTMTVRGSYLIASRLSQTVAASSQLTALSRWAGPAGWVALAGVEVFSVWQYWGGYVTPRQFYLGQAQFAGGLGSGLAGAWAGAIGGAVVGGAIGSFFSPGGTVVGGVIGGVVGGIGGGITGGYFGSQLAGRGAESYFEFRDAQQEGRYVQFLLDHYGAK